MANVRDFGAVGDGVTDDFLAFQAASNHSGSVFVPDGTYYLSQTLVFNNKPVFMYGEGRANSILKFGEVDVGVFVNNALTFSPVDFRDLAITTTSSLHGLALDVLWPGTFDGRLIHKGALSGIQISGYNNTTMGWEKGVRYTDALFVTITDCGIMGRDTGGTSDLSLAAKTASKVGIEWCGGTYPCDFRINNSYITCWDIGFRSWGAPEGLDIHFSTFLNCRIGAYVSPTTFSDGRSAMWRPLLRIGDSHFNCFETCLISSGMIQSIIHDNLFYLGLLQPTGNAVILSETANLDFHNNQIYQFSSNPTACNGLLITNAMVGNVSIQSNFFGSMSTGIWLFPTTAKVYVGKNFFNGPYGFSPIYNQGSNNTVLPQ